MFYREKKKVVSVARYFPRAIVKISVCFLLFLIIPGMLESQALISFDEYPNNPIYGQHTGNGRAYYPCVINLGGSYYLWFADGSGRILRGTSTDGINWTGVTQVTFTPALPPGVSPNHPAVVYHTLIGYKMYFWDGTTGGLSTMVAESTNGLDWSNPRHITQDSVQYLQGSSYGTYWYHHYGPGQVIFNPTATNSGSNPWNYSYTMTFDTSGEGYGTGIGVEHCGLAYSADGDHWYRFGNAPILASINDGSWDSRYIYHGTICRDGNNWYLWYSGANGLGINYYAQGIGEAYSTDGLTWTKFPGYIFHYSDGIAWRNERTYAQWILYENGQYKMWFSGKDSTRYSLGYAYTTCDQWIAGQGPAGQVYNGTAYGFSRHIAVGNQGIMAQSVDGINWTQLTSPTANTLNDIYCNGQYFVTVGENRSLFVSGSDLQWNQRQVTMLPEGTGINGVTFGNNQWIAVCDSGYMIKGSANASTWWAVNLTSTYPDFSEVTYGNNMFLAVGKNNTLITSTDGVLWTSKSLPLPKFNITDVTYSDTLRLYVVVGEGGVIDTSANGSKWTKRTSGTTVDLQGVLWQCNKFAVVGMGGTILESSNGISWTAVIPGISNDLYTVGYSGNTWTALGNNIFLYNVCCN